MAIRQFNGLYVGESFVAQVYTASETGDVLPVAKQFLETTDPIDPKLITGPWHPWGSDNKFPLLLKKLIDNCGELQAIIKAKATFAVNRGILPVQGQYDSKGEFSITNVISDPEIDDFLDESNIYDQLYSMLKDQYGYGNFCGRFAFNLKFDKIARIRRDDITEMRYKKMNENNQIDGIYLCSEWNRVISEDDPRILPFELINLTNAQESLKKLAESKVAQVAFTGREPDWNTKYYSDPDWYAARDWVNINIGVPKMKAAMYENSMRPKYLIKIHNSFWEKFIYIDPATGNQRDFTEDEKRKLREAWFQSVDQYLAGSTNAYKSIWTEFFADAVTGQLVDYIKIESVEDKSFDGELLKDSSTSGSMIAFAMGWNPAINGGSLPSGPYTNSQGGSNVRESTLLQVMMAEPERRRLIRILNAVAKFNGWTDKYKGFKWVISSTIPTTLDTGGSSTPAVQGQ
jgi:hypothetical protein